MAWPTNVALGNHLLTCAGRQQPLHRLPALQPSEGHLERACEPPGHLSTVCQQPSPASGHLRVSFGALLLMQGSSLAWLCFLDSQCARQGHKLKVHQQDAVCPCNICSLAAQQNLPTVPKNNRLGRIMSCGHGSCSSSISSGMQQLQMRQCRLWLCVGNQDLASWSDVGTERVPCD